jgi:glycosyltransferase involved in cell wall biosynthesis
MLENKTVIILSTIEWDFLWQRHQILATFFSRISKKVIYVESLGMRNPDFRDIGRIFRRLINFFKRSLRSKGSREKDQIPKNLILLSPLVLPSTLKIFKTINRKLLIPLLSKIIGDQGAERSLIYNFSPTQAALDMIDILNPSLVIYDCTDNFIEFPGVPKDIEQTEETILKQSDLVFATSDYLFQKIKKVRSDVIHVPAGVDYDHFSQADQGITEQIKTLVFFGGITSQRIDYKLIQEVAKQKPDCVIQMIGPVLSKIEEFPPNVEFPGTVRYEHLPAYLELCDCLFLPYRINEYTKAIFPAKLYECLATGKPIIATALPSFSEFHNELYIVKNAEECVMIIENIKQHKNERKYQARKELARKNSWESRFNEIVSSIERKIEG